MRRSRNFTCLILGILTILLGILIPLFAFNYPVTYEYDKDAQSGQVTFYIAVTSKDEIKDIESAIVNIKYVDGDTEEYETYAVKQSNVDKEFTYEFIIVETDDWEEANRIESVRFKTIDGVMEIDKKVDWSTKIPVMVFCCVIGAFMIVVNFINNNSKNRTNELKKIIASSAYNDFNSYEESEIVAEQVETQELLEGVKEERVNETKACEYCGSLSDINDKVCAYCGAKFKKID